MSEAVSQNHTEVALEIPGKGNLVEPVSKVVIESVPALITAEIADYISKSFETEEGEVEMRRLEVDVGVATVQDDTQLTVALSNKESATVDNGLGMSEDFRRVSGSNQKPSGGDEVAEGGSDHRLHGVRCCFNSLLCSGFGDILCFGKQNVSDVSLQDLH